MFSLIIHLLLLLLSLWMALEAPQNMDTVFMSICVGIAIISLWFFFLSDKNKIIKSQSLRHSVIFIVSYFVVFYQSDIDYILGFIDDYNTLLWYDIKVVCRCMCYSNIGLNSFCLGYKFMSLYDTTKNMEDKPLSAYRFKYKKELCLLGYLLLFYYVFTVDKEYLFGGYGLVKQDTTNVVIMVMFQAVLIGIFTMYCYEFRENKQGAKLIDFYKKFKLPLFLALLYVVVILISSRRTEAIRILFLLLICYLYSTKSVLSLKKIAMVAVLLGFIMTVVGIFRDAEVTSLSDSSLTRDLSISPLTRELSGSVATFHTAVSNIPSPINYNYGLTFFPKFFVLLPYGQQTFFNLTGLTDEATSSDVLITSLQPNFVNWGVGTSILADIYVSFGVIGIIIVLFIIGLYLRYLERKTFCIRQSPYILILSFCAYSGLVYLSRSSISSLFLSVSYSFILVFFGSKISKFKLFQKKKLDGVNNTNNFVK